MALYILKLIYDNFTIGLSSDTNVDPDVKEHIEGILKISENYPVAYHSTTTEEEELKEPIKKLIRLEFSSERKSELEAFGEEIASKGLADRMEI